MNIMTHVCVTAAQIGITAWINMKLKFAQSEMEATRAMNNGLVQIARWTAVCVVVVVFIDFLLSPLPVSRMEIVSLGITILLFSVQYSLGLALDAARAHRIHVGLLFTLSEKVLALAAMTIGVEPIPDRTKAPAKPARRKRAGK